MLWRHTDCFCNALVVHVGECDGDAVAAVAAKPKIIAKGIARIFLTPFKPVANIPEAQIVRESVDFRLISWLCD